MSGLMRNIIIAYHSTVCQKKIRLGKIASARRSYNKILKFGALKPRLVALGARISMLEKDPLAARAQMNNALRMSIDRKSSREEYVKMYCYYFINLIDNTGNHEKYRSIALELEVPEFYRYSLPFPDIEIS